MQITHTRLDFFGTPLTRHHVRMQCGGGGIPQHLGRGWEIPSVPAVRGTVPTFHTGESEFFDSCGSTGLELIVGFETAVLDLLEEEG